MCNYPVRGGDCTPGRWVHIYIYTYSYKNNGSGVEMLHPTVSVVPARPSIPAARVKLPKDCPQPLAQGVVVVCRCILFFFVLCLHGQAHPDTARRGRGRSLPLRGLISIPPRCSPRDGGMGSSVGPAEDAGLCPRPPPHAFLPWSLRVGTAPAWMS